VYKLSLLIQPPISRLVVICLIKNYPEFLIRGTNKMNCPECNEQLCYQDAESDVGIHKAIWCEKCDKDYTTEELYDE
tara:strand:- start:157 stop:387 length:231 start_codon:yes stop_codon:yes gene_type:complete